MVLKGDSYNVLVLGGWGGLRMGDGFKDQLKKETHSMAANWINTH